MQHQLRDPELVAMDAASLSPNLSDDARNYWAARRRRSWLHMWLHIRDIDFDHTMDKNTLVLWMQGKGLQGNEPPKWPVEDYLAKKKSGEIYFDKGTGKQMVKEPRGPGRPPKEDK